MYMMLWYHAVCLYHDSIKTLYYPASEIYLCNVIDICCNNTIIYISFGTICLWLYWCLAITQQYDG